MRTCEHCGVVSIDVDEVQYTLNYPNKKYTMLCDECFNAIHGD